MPNKKQYSGMDMSGNKVTGLPAPSGNSDAATKQYVDQNAGGAPLASTVSFTPPVGFPTSPNNPADNVQEAVENLFTYANSGKSAIAGAIGSPAASTDTFATLTGYVTTAKGALDTFIDAAEGTTTGSETLAQLTSKLDQVRTFKQDVKLTKNAGSTSTYTLGQYNGAYPAANKLLVTPYIRIDDDTTTEVVATFNNGYPNDFVQNNYIVFEGGFAKTRTTYDATYSSPSGGIKSVVIDMQQLQTFQATNITSTTMSYSAIPVNQVLEPSGFIDISSVEDIMEIDFIGQTFNINDPVHYLLPWIAVSLNNGESYHTWYSGAWTTVDITDTSEYLNKKAAYTEYTPERLAQLRTSLASDPNIDKLKFAYLFENYYSTNEFINNKWILSAVDNVSLDVVISGTFVPAMQAGATANPPTITYNAGNGQLTITYNQTDAYIINYLDT